jgi:hypothetical protein
MNPPDDDANWFEGLVPERIVMPADEFDWFVELLEQEPQVIPSLRRLFERPSRIDRSR